MEQYVSRHTGQTIDDAIDAIRNQDAIINDLMAQIIVLKEELAAQKSYLSNIENHASEIHIDLYNEIAQLKALLSDFSFEESLDALV